MVIQNDAPPPSSRVNASFVTYQAPVRKWERVEVWGSHSGAVGRARAESGARVVGRRVTHASSRLSFQQGKSCC